jgi:hypothetical protein
MRSTLSAIFVASSVALAAAQGQQPAPSQQPATPAQQPAPQTQAAPRQQSETGQLTKTTISGCIQNVAPAAGAAASAPTASKFELASAKMVTPAPVGTSGTATDAVRYRLEGDEKLITPHLNQQVEITGTVSPSSGTGATVAPMLKVESVKMVSATCPKGPAQ